MAKKIDHTTYRSLFFSYSFLSFLNKKVAKNNLKGIKKLKTLPHYWTTLMYTVMLMVSLIKQFLHKQN